MSMEILMPALSPTMEQGDIANWLVKEGDTIKPGDVIAEIETDKATMEMEAVDEGVIAKILVPAGTQGVQVNTPIAVLSVAGEENASPDVRSDGGDRKADGARNTAAIAGAQQPSKVRGGETGASDGRVFVSPLARRMAADAGLDLAAIKGSGPQGRIVRTDVDTARTAAPAAAAPTPVAEAPIPAVPQPSAPPSTTISDEDVFKLFDAEMFEALPHDVMRRTIAGRLTQSTQNIPSYLVTMDCELDALMALRADLNAAAPGAGKSGETPGYRLSINDFIIKALALALRDVPMANASWTSTARLLHRHADIGVAVAIPDGVITPIVRRAEAKSLSAISREVKDLAARGREKKLRLEEYQGGTAAVSNLGMFGVSSFTSIINPPHAMIVSIGAGAEKALVANGEVRVATQMTATFAFDHRVIDGALGAELASAFKGYIEHPFTALA